MATAISFDTNSLQTSNILTNDIPHETSPIEDAKLLTIAHASKSVIPFLSYPSRAFNIKGRLQQSSISALDSLIDIFKAYFAGKQDKNLDIGYNSGTRRYTATPVAVKIDRPKGLNYADFEIDFVMTQPFGMDTATQTALNATARTSASYSDNYTFLGTAPWQVPIFTFTLTAVTGGTNASVIIGNSNTGQQITVTRTWSASDVLTIDPTDAMHPVKVNGSAVDFTGALPLFQTGAQTITYSDNFTTRTFNINAVYTPLYL